MAEGVGFEPTVELPQRLISSQVPLTTQPPFRSKDSPQYPRFIRRSKPNWTSHLPVKSSDYIPDFSRIERSPLFSYSVCVFGSAFCFGAVSADCAFFFPVAGGLLFGPSQAARQFGIGIFDVQDAAMSNCL